MAYPKLDDGDAGSLGQAAGAQKWRRLLPTEADDEEERERKRLQLMKLLHVKCGHLDASLTSQQQQQQQQHAEEHQPQRPQSAHPPREEQQQQQPPLPEQQRAAQAEQAAWRQAVRSSAGKEQPQTQLAAAAPVQAAAAPEQAVAAADAAPGHEAARASPVAAGTGPDTAGGHEHQAAAAEGECGAEFHTPLGTRMLPGPGKAAHLPPPCTGQAAEHPSASGGAAGPASSSGVPSAVPSSGVSTLPSTAGASTGAAAVAAQRVGRRRLPPTQPAMGSGRLPLSAGGFLSIGRPIAAAPHASGGMRQQQRRWRQQQQLQSQPLARMLRKQPAQPTLQLSQLALDGAAGAGAFQPARPSRFAPPEPALVFAPASLTTQIGASQDLGAALPDAGTQQAAPAATLAPSQPQQEEQTLQPQLAPLQPQPQPQPAPQQPQQGDEEQQQAQQQVPTLQQEQQAQQQALRQPPQQAHARAAALPGAATAAPGTEWTLPPTPSCMRDLSPISPAAVAPGSDPVGTLQRGQAGGWSTAGQRLRRAAAAAAAGTEPDSLLARLPDLALTAETPLLASPGSAQLARGGERQQAAVGSGQRLFVAETPADATARASDGGSKERRPPHLAPAPALASALEAAAAAGGLAAPGAAAQTPAAAPAGPAAQAAASKTPAAASAAAPVHMPAVTPAAAAAPAAAALTAGGVPAAICGLQLQLPQPVLQAVPCADGRHVALLLGNFAPAGEPSEVLVLQLPEQPPTPAAAGPGRQAAGAAGAAGSRDACCGVRVVASVVVQRSRWGHAVELTPNCLQLAATDKAGLQLVLSAALELPDEPPAQQPVILVLPLGGARGSSPAVPEPPAAGQAAQGRGRRGRASARLLSIECREHHPLTCVLLAGGGALLAAGDGCGDVRRLQFDPLWRSYTWGPDLPPALFRHIPLEDLQQLALYRDPDGCTAAGSGAPPRTLLLGISGGGSVALWDYGRSELLAVKSSHRYRLRALHPVSAALAGLTTPVKQRVAAGAAAACAASPSPALGGIHLFGGLARERETGEQHVAAVVLCPGGLMVSSRGAVAPPRLQPGRRAAQQHPQADRVTAVSAAAGGICWLGTAAGELLPWDLQGLPGGSAAAALASPGGRVHGCSGGGAVTALCALPSAEWRLLAASAGGALVLL